MNNLGTDLLWLPIGVECCNYVPTYNECVHIGELFFILVLYMCMCIHIHKSAELNDMQIALTCVHTIRIQ